MEYVSESGKVFKTSKGHLIKLLNESDDDEYERFKKATIDSKEYIQNARSALVQALNCLDMWIEEAVDTESSAYKTAKLRSERVGDALFRLQHAFDK